MVKGEEDIQEQRLKEEQDIEDSMGRRVNSLKGELDLRREGISIQRP